jgi:hypothetical protein
MAGIDMGFIAEARRSLRLVMQEAEALESPEAACLAHAFSPVVTQIAGDDPAPCLRDARTAAAMADRIGSPFALMMARWGLGIAHRLNGDAAAAVDALDAALAGAREKKVGIQLEGGVLASLADALLEQGNGEEALRCAEEAVATATRRRTRFFACLGRLGLAHVLLELHGSAAASRVEEALRAAERFIAAESLLSLEPMLRGTRAQLAAMCGDYALAQRELAATHRRCVEIGADGHAARLEALVDLGAVA